MLNDIITYTPIPQVNHIKAKAEVNSIFQVLYNNQLISKQQKNFFIRCTPNLPNLFGLPKIHKPNWPLRPIVSQIDAPSYKLNKYLDYLLTTAEKEIPNLLQDTTKFLNIIHNTPPIPPNTLLFTIDVTSLYTVLPHSLVIDYVLEMYTETLGQWHNIHLI